MSALTNLLTSALVVLGMVLTSGPNMIYLISRSICQGCNAGLAPLAGIVTGFVFYMLCATFGIAALLMAVPFTYDALRSDGTIYLLYLTWQAVRPGDRVSFQVRGLPVDSSHKFYTIGLLTSLFNPKVAVLYLSLLPQFIEPVHDNVLVQSICLGFAQICVNLTVNSMIVIMAGNVATFLSYKPSWPSIQRCLMGTVLTSLALRMAMETRK